MVIYTAFVSYNQLISPVTGYTCRRITKQNIKQFGFTRIEELLIQFPGFPLMCEEYHDSVKMSSMKAKIVRAEIVKMKILETETYRKSEYEKHPYICHKCGLPKPYEKRNNGFCSRKCASSRSQTEEIKKQKSIKLKRPEKTSIRIKDCIQCNHKFISSEIKGNEKAKLCDKCKSIRAAPKLKMCCICSATPAKHHGKYCLQCSPNLSIYRSRASFNFNVYDYPQEFELSLVEQHGWYSPNGYKRRNKTPNLNGVSRDHLYSVLDGFENKINPEIISHPANCKIMIHNGPNSNNTKKSNSSITLEELLVRIDIWEIKYGEGMKNRTSREPPVDFTTTVLQTADRKSPRIIW